MQVFSYAIDYAGCLVALLEGLGIQNIKDFMRRASEENCLKLGLAYSQACKDKIASAQQLETLLDNLEKK